MASITKRSYSSWQVTAKDSTLKIKRIFLSKSEALGFAWQLEADDIAVAKPAKTEPLAWQAQLCKLSSRFRNKDGQQNNLLYSALGNFDGKTAHMSIQLLFIKKAWN